MFKSATLKLTVWYVFIVISISLLFSVIIYSIALSEVSTRISYLQQSRPAIYNSNPTFFDAIREAQLDQARSNLVGALLITNLSIWFAGGFGSYYLARRSLRPIERAHEAQSRFTSDASHEFRTPLASMKVELEVALRDDDMTREEMNDLIKSNLEEVNKLTRLSHTLLQLSRLEYKNIDREKVELRVATKAAIERFGESEQRLKLHATRPLHVLANESSVEELITILVDNALKYSPSDSTVDVKLINKRSMAGFKVTNTGDGISPEALPHIFDRFYRADASRTGHEKKSYGLGLSLAKKIVELHGGELTVSSAVWQTTCFQVLLPVYKNTPTKK